MDYLIPLSIVSVLAVVCINWATVGLTHANAIRRLVMLGLLLRFALCVAFYAMPSIRIFHEDADGYEILGVLIARGWHGDGPPVHMENTINYGHFYWNAILCYLFGGYRLYPSLTNSVISCVTAVLLYRMAAKSFIEPIARRALMLALFFPSMILWSAMACKDTVMLFLVVGAMYSTLELRRKLSVRHVIIVCAMLLGIFVERFYMFYMTFLAVIISLTFLGRSRGKSLANQILLCVAIAVVFMFFGLRQEAERGLSSFNFENVQAVRYGLATTANSGWRSDVDISTPGKAIAFLPLGVLFLLLAPFPWQFTSLRPILTLPEMLLWWGMTFSWLRGLRYVVTSRRRELTPLVVFTLILTLAYSLVHGNAGIAFRQRSQIMIFLFLMAAIGRTVKRFRAHGIPASAVELPAPGSAEAQAEPLTTAVPPVARGAMGARMKRADPSAR